MIRLAVRVQGGHAELVLAELLELSPTGVEEHRAADGSVEYALYGAPGELPELPALQAAAGGALVEISTSEIRDDWHERWREFHRPVLIAAPPRAAGVAPVPSLRIRPPWEPPLSEAQGANALREIVIDPGRAFGTGGHASTRLCLELLVELAASRRQRGACLDVGTGSGVLALAAAVLGFAPVAALDHDQQSVDAARANALANDTALEPVRLDLRSQALPWSGDGLPARGPALVLANLLRPLLLELAAALPAAPAQLIAGGLLAQEVDEVAGALLDRLGVRERARRERGEWAAVWLTATGGAPAPAG